HGFHLYLSFFIVMIRLPPISTLFPYTTLFRSNKQNEAHWFFHSHCCSPLNIHLSIFNMKITAILVAFTLFVIPGMAQYSPDKASDISSLNSQFADNVKVLSHDSLEGRNTLSEGIRKAERIILQQISESGVKPFDAYGSFLQKVPLAV